MARKGITLEDFDRMHVEDGRLFWDGEQVITEKRWSAVERGLAITGLLIAAVGVAATVAQAWAAFQIPMAEVTDLQFCIERLEAEEQANSTFDALTYCNSVL